MKKPKKTDLHIYIEPSVMKLLRNEAEKDRRSVTQLVRVIIDKHYNPGDFA